MTNIVFSPDEEEDDSEKVIRFEVIVDGLVIPCSASYSLLSEFFDADYCDPLFAFMTGRPKIERAVISKLGTDANQNTKEIIINNDDMRNIIGSED